MPIDSRAHDFLVADQIDLTENEINFGDVLTLRKCIKPLIC